MAILRARVLGQLRTLYDLASSDLAFWYGIAYACGWLGMSLAMMYVRR